MFIVFLLLSHVVSWVRCGTWLYRFLIFASFLTLRIRNTPLEVYFIQPINLENIKILEIIWAPFEKG